MNCKEEQKKKKITICLQGRTVVSRGSERQITHSFPGSFPSKSLSTEFRIQQIPATPIQCHSPIISASLPAPDTLHFLSSQAQPMLFMSSKSLHSGFHQSAYFHQLEKLQLSQQGGKFPFLPLSLTPALQTLISQFQYRRLPELLAMAFFEIYTDRLKQVLPCCCQATIESFLCKEIYCDAVLKRKRSRPSKDFS